VKSRAWILIVLCVIALCAAVFSLTFKRESVTERTEVTGAAAYNRFFALQEILRGMGEPATSSVLLGRTLPGLDPGDTVVIGDSVSQIEPDDARALADWVRKGGHLVFSPGLAAGREVPLLQQLDLLVDASKRQEVCVMLSADVVATKGAHPDTRLCAPGFTLPSRLPGHANVTLGNQQGLVFAQISEGQGTVSLLSNMGVLSGQELRNEANQAFARRVLAPNMGQGQIYLFYALVGQSFWLNLFVRGWPALLASLLLLAGWMAMRSERLGPLIPVAATHRRALLEHIQAVGEFLFRRDNGRSLHRLASTEILERLRRRDPASAMLQDTELYEWLAQRSQLELPRIELAFRSPANAAAFRGSILTLARLRSHL
jgi:hypothetical protein